MASTGWISSGGSHFWWEARGREAARQRPWRSVTARSPHRPSGSGEGHGKRVGGVTVKSEAGKPAALTDSSASAALRFVVFLGVVSLFADMTYEGARSVTGPFLAILGASGAAVGIVAGFGELVGYGLRLVSGFIADRTRRY